MDTVNFLKELTHANPHYVDIITISTIVTLINQKDKDEFLSLIFKKLSLKWLFDKKIFQGFFYLFSISLLSLWTLTIILLLAGLLFSGKILFKISFDYEFLISALTLFNNLSLTIGLYSILYYKINRFSLTKVLTNFFKPKNNNRLLVLGVSFVIGGIMGAFSSRYGDLPTFIFLVVFALFFCIKFLLENTQKNQTQEKAYRKNKKN